MMKAADILREITFPFTDLAVLLAIIVIFLLGKLAAAAGLLGLWLGLILVPAFFRYLLYVLEARALNRMVPPLAGELFSLVENFWSLFPLVLMAVFIWGEVFLVQHANLPIAILFGIAVALIYPASMSVLAITRSPLQSLNPVSIFNLIRMCGVNYFVIVGVVAVLVAVLIKAVAGGLPLLIAEFLAIYLAFLLFAFSGAVVGRSGASANISIPDPQELAPEEVENRANTDRVSVLNHAYGFISRNNRAGGLAHIQSFVDASSDPLSEYRWFYEAMLNWESSDAALFFAQTYLTSLLDADLKVDAVKLIARCRLENPRFKPLTADRERALEVAIELGNDELAAYLRSV